MATPDLDAMLATLSQPAGPQMPANIAAIVKKAAKNRTKKEKNTLRAWQQSNARPQYSAPQTEYPPFLMELLGGGEDYTRTSDSALMAQASQMAQSQAAPGMAQIRSMLSGGTAAINELTGEIAGRMQPIAGQVQGLYNAAGAQTGQVNQAMANRLQQMGMEQQAGLNQAFQAAGLEASAPLAQNVADTAAAASQASFATGSSNLNRLAAEGAAAGSYAAGLPGVASLGGQAAIAALAREAQAATAGIAAQTPGLQQEAYRMLRSSEDARADAAGQRRSELAGALMDWNQNKENIALQVYSANLAMFGDEQKARQAQANYMADLGMEAAGMVQDESQFQQTLGENARQFDVGRQDDIDAALADSMAGAASDRNKLVGEKQDYLDLWRGKAATRAERLARGYDVEGSAGEERAGRTAGSTTQHRRYTQPEFRRMLTRFLTPPLRQSEAARRFGLKERAIDRIVRQTLMNLPPGTFRPRPRNRYDVPGPGA